MAKFHVARTRRLMIAGVAALSLVAAACSSDDNSNSGSGDTAALGEENKATGDPVVVGVINEQGSPDSEAQSSMTRAGFEMAAKYANDYLGGIGGRPIELKFCGNKNTAAGATDCANQMVEAGIDAYTMPYSAQEAIIVKILTAAKIPMVLFSSSSTEGLTTPGVFAISGGYPATLGGFALDAKEQGITNFQHMVIDVPSATGAATQLGGLVFGKAGVKYGVIPVPLGTADFTPLMQSAIDKGADAIGVTGDASFCASWAKAYKSLALTVTKYLISVCTAANVVAEAGDVLEGSRVAASTIKGDDAKLYAAIVAKYGTSDIDPNPMISNGQASGVQSLLSLVAATSGITGDINAETIMAKVKTASAVKVPLLSDLTFTCDGKAIAMLPNICSAQVQIGVAKADGTVPEPKAFDAASLFVMG